MTGHRPNGLQHADPRALRVSIDSVLDSISYLTGRPGTVLSPLAEGADRLVAHAALEDGCELICPLPFPREDYERDFATVASRNEYRELLARAAEVIELPGLRDSPAHENAAYAAAGHFIVETSDLLLAIWDGERARGSGGTAEVVVAALARRLPVVWINSAAPHRAGVIDDPATGKLHSLDRLPAILARR